MHAVTIQGKHAATATATEWPMPAICCEMYISSSLQQLEALCEDIHTAFSGRSLCSISNSPLLCTALLKASCCLQNYTTPDSPSQRSFLSPGGAPSNFLSSPRSSGAGMRTHSRKSSLGGGGGVDNVDGMGSGREMFGRSKPIPIQQRQRAMKHDRESLPSQGFFPNSTCGVGSHTSPANLPQSWSIIGSNERDRIGSRGGSRKQTPQSYRSWVIIPEPSDSELESGYEADVERGSHNIEVAESCGEMEDGELREGELLRSLTSYLVPPEVRQRVWIMLPIWNCIDLLRESVSQGLSPQGYVHVLHCYFRIYFVHSALNIVKRMLYVLCKVECFMYAK